MFAKIKEDNIYYNSNNGPSGKIRLRQIFSASDVKKNPRICIVRFFML